MNSIFWFAMGILAGWLFFSQPQYIAEVGNWLVEQSQKLSNK